MALTVHPTNPRYFQDGTGCFPLIGAHTWHSVQDYGYAYPLNTYDYDAYLDMLVAAGHNCTRLWSFWSLAIEFSPTRYKGPTPYSRSGPGNAADGQLKLDLSTFNESYFTRLRDRVVKARAKGIYVSVMLFEAWSSRVSTAQWATCYFNPANNINSISGDSNADSYSYEAFDGSISAIVTLQDAFIEKVVDTLNDLDGYFYEVCNENRWSTSAASWTDARISKIRTYEAGKAKQHMVYNTTLIPTYGSSSEVSALTSYINGSDAEIVNPPGRQSWTDPMMSTDIPAVGGTKPVICDTDHLWGIGGSPEWAWRVFMRGYNLALMDAIDPSYGLQTLPDYYSTAQTTFLAMRRVFGSILSVAKKVSLASLIPDTTSASTAYCLSDGSTEFLVYQYDATSSFTVTIGAGTYRARWYDALTGTDLGASEFSSAGETKTFTPTSTLPNGAVLHLVKQATPHTVTGGLLARYVTQ